MKLPFFLFLVLTLSVAESRSAFAEQTILACASADKVVSVEIAAEKSSAGWPDFHESRYYPVTVTADAGSVPLRGQGDPQKPELGLFGIDEGEGFLTTSEATVYLIFRKGSPLASVFLPDTLEKYYDGVRSFSARGYRVALTCQ